MGNCKFTLEDCVIEMRSEVLARTRYNAEKDEFDTSLTVSEAYEVARRTLEKMLQAANPSPAPKKPREEKQAPLPRLGGPDVTTHEEKAFKFADGTVKQCCAAAGCEWGRTTKKHSDGMTGETLYALDNIPDTVEPEVEVSIDDPVELQADGTRGTPLDEGEIGIVPELLELEELIDGEGSPSEVDEETEPCLA